MYYPRPVALCLAKDAGGMKRKSLEIEEDGLERLKETPRILTGCDLFDSGDGKRMRLEISGDREIFAGGDFFDALPDDLVLSVLCKLGAAAECPADFVSLALTCRRLNGLCNHSPVLSKASQKMFAVRAKNWSESAHRFLKRCSDAGNLEACYTLGMIRFYCFQSRGSGASLMAKAAIGGHAQALYSLAVIQFNGSGGSRDDKDLRAGIALCARAAFLGHVDAIRELGHCLQDGYGVKKNIAEGRRFLVRANVLELAVAFGPNHSSTFPPAWLSCPDLGSKLPLPEPHPVNRFLLVWFSGECIPCPDLRLCSHSGCGRPETRRHEFRRCSVCGEAIYCSRACQAVDWKLRHKLECSPGEIWAEHDGDDVCDDIFLREYGNAVGET